MRVQSIALTFTAGSPHDSLAGASGEPERPIERYPTAQPRIRNDATRADLALAPRGNDGAARLQRLGIGCSPQRTRLSSSGTSRGLVRGQATHGSRVIDNDPSGANGAPNRPPMRDTPFARTPVARAEHRAVERAGLPSHTRAVGRNGSGMVRSNGRATGAWRLEPPENRVTPESRARDEFARLLLTGVPTPVISLFPFGRNLQLLDSSSTRLPRS